MKLNLMAQTLKAFAVVQLLIAIPALAATHVIEIAFVGDRNAASFKGVQQGLVEGNLQGEFLGVEYRIVDLQTTNAAVAIIAAVPVDELANLVTHNRHLPVINVAMSDNHLRAECILNVFHTIPSQQMFTDAVAQWRSKNPSSAATASAWHRTFKKYAASQLNIRYHETFDESMDDLAWAGWAATKLLADTLIRSPALTGSALIDELRTNVAFDGQKGIDMSFRETGQLSQPVLLIENDKIVGEAPVRGVVDITDLDSLGEVNCPK